MWWKNKVKEWNYILQSEDSSGYYWRHVSKKHWRLWSPNHELVGAAYDSNGLLDFFLVGQDKWAAWSFDADKTTWKTMIILKILGMKVSAAKEVKCEVF